jgi:ATP-dependent RNA helicase DeaD
MSLEKNKFAQLNLLAPIQQALDAFGFKEPTPIQAKAIPMILKGSDLIGSAQTGTGKTAAFCIPVLTSLIKDSNKNALILVPTRELAIQIEEFWKVLTQFCKEQRSATLIGGVSMQAQLRQIQRKPRLIIATPGRLVDHLQRRSVSLKTTAFLVLDEADRMLDMGFAPQLNEIVRSVPTDRQTLFFSATWNSATDLLAKKFLRNPVERVAVGETSRAAHTVTQTLLKTTTSGKRDLLLEEINSKQGSILVFARTKHGTDRVAKYLDSYGISVNRLHGGRSQGQRNTALNAFREGDIRVLVATDIAARGIDVSEIAHVINYDLPQVAEDYIHRIGRTGRAGETGTATSFVTGEDAAMWNDIAKLLKKTGSVIPSLYEKKITRPVNAQGGDEVIEAVQPASHRPTRSHPGQRRENQWKRGTTQVKPQNEQRFKQPANKAAAASVGARGSFIS